MGSTAKNWPPVQPLLDPSLVLFCMDFRIISSPNLVLQSSFHCFFLLRNRRFKLHLVQHDAGKSFAGRLRFLCIWGQHWPPITCIFASSTPQVLCMERFNEALDLTELSVSSRGPRAGTCQIKDATSFLKEIHTGQASSLMLWFFRCERELEPEVLRKRKGFLKLAHDFCIFPDSKLRTKSNFWLGP